jgi:hypothetical protein
MQSHITLRNIWLGFVALPWRSASAIDACASFGRFASAFDAMQHTRATSTASVSPFRGGIFFVLYCASCLPSIWVFAHQHLLRCGTAVPTLHTMPISHFPLIFAIVLGVPSIVLF